MSDNSGTKRSRILNFLYRLCWCVVLIFVYFVFVAPTLAYFLTPLLFTHKDVDCFVEGKYERYRRGDQFHEFVETLGFVEDDHVIDFLHRNNILYYNPFQEECSDVFMLDLKIPAEEYGKIKRDYLNNDPMTDIGKWEDFEFYSDCIEGDAYEVAFCDDQGIIRCSMVTNSEWAGSAIDMMMLGVQWDY